MINNELERERRQILAALKSLPPGEIAQAQMMRLSVIDAELTQQRQEIEQLQAREDRLTVSDLVQRYHIAYLADDHKFSITWNTSNDPDTYNVISKLVSAERIIHSLNSMLSPDDKIQKMRAEDIIRYCQYNNRSYITMTSSFNQAKWSIGCYNQLLDLKRFWVEPDLSGQEPHHLFNDLIWCLCGGRQENIDHLERWIIYKYARPDDVVNIPHINISGIPGENGKGLFKLLLKTLFTAGSVVDASAKELINGFNAKWKDAVILIYEEMGERELPENKIKSVTGNPELNVELKGKDAFVVDANYSILFFDNNVAGSIKLAGSGPNGEDRRYSIIETNISLPVYLQTRYGIDSETAKMWCSDLAVLLRQRSEVSRYLGHLFVKHGTGITQAPKLHGVDYWNRVTNQQTDVDSVIRDLAQAVVRQRVLPSRLMLEHLKIRVGEDTRVTQQKLNRLVISELKRQGQQPCKERISTAEITYDGRRDVWNHPTVIAITQPGPHLRVSQDPFADTQPPPESQDTGLFDYDES
jgi:hypothetical protein